MATITEALPRTHAPTYEGLWSWLTAIERVSLDVRAGEFVAIVGPSGSGKSTLFHILGGLTPATSGHVTIEGTDFANAVFENANLFGARLADCRLAGASFTAATLTGLVVEGGDWSYVSLRGHDLSGAVASREFAEGGSDSAQSWIE